MKIYDKAAWQIDNGIANEVVINHFTLIFSWLKEQGMLNKDGMDIFEIGVDEDTSLNEGLVTIEGVRFLNKYYDEIITKSEYDIELEKKLLTEYYKNF